MNISLSSKTHRLLESHRKAGGYKAVEEVIQAGLRSLEQQERLGQFKRAELKALLAEGERSIQQEGTLDGDAAFAERRQRREARAKST
jgi:putative addiction module CopG family antidote